MGGPVKTTFPSISRGELSVVTAPSGTLPVFTHPSVKPDSVILNLRLGCSSHAPSLGLCDPLPRHFNRSPAPYYQLELQRWFSGCPSPEKKAPGSHCWGCANTYDIHKQGSRSYWEIQNKTRKNLSPELLPKAESFSRSDAIYN